MLTPGHLEVTAHALTAILGAWLGLTVLTRSRTVYARVFGLLALTLALWSTSVIVQRLSSAPSTGSVLHAIEELAAAVIVPATAHFSLLIATEGHPSRRQWRAVVAAYVLNVAFAIPGAIDRTAPIAISTPQLAIGPLPAVLLGWAWIGTRVVTLFAAAGWLLQAFRRSSPDAARRRQLGQTLAFVVIGTLGGMIRLLSVVMPTDPWIGVSLVTVGMVLSASVVFSAGVFFAPDVAGRAFRRSIGVGLGVFLVVGLLLALDAISRQVLGLDVPLLPVAALVVALAVYEPAVTWWRSRIDGRSPGDVARERLLRAIGEPSLGTATASAGVQPALARVASALDLAGAIVLREGETRPGQGVPEHDRSPAIPLVVDDEVFGELRVGPTTSGAPLSAGDEALLRLSAAYVAAALRAGRREDEQVDLLTDLTQERARVQDAAEELHDALARRATDGDGLRVYALGPLRVERGDDTIERWGGEKAGTRQAQGLFAFLFDRGERGLDKDEALELIWPDTAVDRADLAFHRTLGGLRHTLDPRGDGGKRAVRFRNDRYRLDPGIVQWSDVATFLGRLDAARGASSAPERMRLLEEARVLYRGEYLDDCPFYGDSVHVDERRGSLRARAVDLLVALGHGYEETGDPVSAAAAYRDAAAVATDECPAAVAGLARIAGA
ncbi:MAG TPA: hypothetical protein VGK16_08685 [Candidatus Limnocylindrales bacterium]